MVVVIGVIGFWYLEGLNPLDALYLAITTITTVGYGDIVPETPTGKIFTAGLILSGVGVAIYVLTGIIGLVLEGRLHAAFGMARVKRSVAKMKNHMIICGGGRTGNVIVDKLRSEGLDLVVIEYDSEVTKELRKRGIPVVEGDATKDEVLVEAGVERASGLVSTLPSDADNLFLCITAKELNRDLKIVTRASSKEAAKRLYSIGVKKAVMVEEIGGRRLAKSLTKPAIVDFFDFATKTGEASLESLTVEQGAKIANKKIKELRIKERIGASIVAIIREGKVIPSVGPEDEIKEGDTVVVIGKKESLDKLEESDFF
jgi:voltage-gated potassium channel